MKQLNAKLRKMTTKYFMPILVASLLSIACTDGNRHFFSTVNFVKIEVEKTGPNPASDSAYKVAVQYNNPVDAPQYLRDSILKHTKLLFASWFDVSGNFDLNASVKKHRDEYVKLARGNNLPGYQSFKLKITPEDVYQNDHLLSFSYNWFLYESGARGIFGKYCFVLKKDDGSKLVLDNLLKNKNKEEFMKLAEIEFKEQAGMKADEEMYKLYRFKNNVFHLNNCFAFNVHGLAFHYNPQEIAPYSAGLIKFILPYEKIGDYVEYVPKTESK